MLRPFTEVAIANLCRLAWPTKLEGARQQDGGRVIVVATSDGLGVEPTPPSRPAPAVLRPPREPVPGRHPGSRYPRCLFRPAPHQAADRAPVAQGSSHVGLSHYPPALSCNARRHRAGPQVNPGHAGGSRPRGGVTPVRVGGPEPVERSYKSMDRRLVAHEEEAGLQILSVWSVGVVVRSYPGPNDFSMADRRVQESIPQTQAIHWGERFDESTLSDPSCDLVEKSDTEGFAPTPYE